ncbi:MAG: cell division protein SepF [Peptococcaceae bacterium BRH_c4b]|nr:MAG: cell division protein SepF [Peptococcaceae bacterium BRH_c4b]
MAAKKLMDKMLGFMGFEEEQLEEDEKFRDDRYHEEEETTPAKRRGQVVNLHAQRQLKVVVVEPHSFDEVQGIADNLKSRRPVIINLEKADAELAKRVVDFISGCTYALNGTLQKVGNGIFLSVPSNMDIACELKDQIKEQGILSWIR